jgi:hypothetical protein
MGGTFSHTSNKSFAEVHIPSAVGICHDALNLPNYDQFEGAVNTASKFRMVKNFSLLSI